MAIADIEDTIDNIKRSIKYLHRNTQLKNNSRLIDCINHLETNVSYLEAEILKLKFTEEIK